MKMYKCMGFNFCKSGVAVSICRVGNLGVKENLRSTSLFALGPYPSTDLPRANSIPNSLAAPRHNSPVTACEVS